MALSNFYSNVRWGIFVQLCTKNSMQRLTLSHSYWPFFRVSSLWWWASWTTSIELARLHIRLRNHQFEWKRPIALMQGSWSLGSFIYYITVVPLIYEKFLKLFQAPTWISIELILTKHLLRIRQWRERVKLCDTITRRTLKILQGFSLQCG